MCECEDDGLKDINGLMDGGRIHSMKASGGNLELPLPPSEVCTEGLSDQVCLTTR